MKTLPLDSDKAMRRVVVDTRVEDAAAVDDDDIRFCLDYWNQARGSTFAPRWRDFHLDELKPHQLPFILVLDVSYEPTVYRYRYWGTGHTRYHQRDDTGLTLGDMTEIWSAKLLSAQYDQVIAARKPLVFINSYDGVDTPLKSLRMPLSDDGETVTKLFSFVGRGGLGDDMKRLFGTN